MKSRRDIVQILAAALAMFAARFLFDATAASEFAYPAYQLGQKPVALIVLLICIVSIGMFAIVRLVQRRVWVALAFAATLAIPFLFPNAVDAIGWRFKVEKQNYLSLLAAEGQSLPKYHVFDWGNENTSLGGGLVARAIVYDETDHVAEPAEVRPQEWNERRAAEAPEHRWIVAPPPTYRCAKHFRRLDGHFYYIAMTC